ncbi:hypothetical protein [Gracilibacillus dipsosauri]|uniref:hypothetical protein n=1 Tax=Gracilibacillus dipsosauri TaxID=178340 RepID=UPI00240A3E36
MPHAYDVKVDFYGDWISRLRNQLIEMNYQPAESSQDVCFQYFNLQRRLIPSKPRNVLFSQEFTCPKNLEPGLRLVKEKIEKGLDIKPHLSKLILDLNYHDDLLNDWEIHHLHLGTKMESNSDFIKRTGPVLFIRFDAQNAYFIDVMPHGSWAKQKMVTSLHNNWPNSIERFRMKGAHSVSPQLTDNHIN